MASLLAFPSITPEEFSQACEALESRSEDRLAGTDWLSVRWTGEELLIKEIRKLRGNDRASDEESGSEAEDELVEEDDEVSILRESLGSMIHTAEVAVIDFSITLSPTYCVPVLWFSLQSDREKKHPSLEQVYDCLVPELSQASLRGVGVMGGISTAHHPISDRPAFFLHPCNTHAALLAVRPNDSLTAEQYLMLWLGVVGSAVGLHIPSKLLSA